MKKFILFFSVLAALICSSCVKPEPDIWGSISGVVKDAQSNQPIEGVKVTVTATGASQITNSDGQFTFDNLDATEYSLSFEKSGYLTRTQKVTVLAGETATAQVQLTKNNLGIEVSHSMLDFGLDKNSINVTVSALGNQPVHFDVSTSDSWITVTPNGGNVSSSASAVIRVMVNRSLAAGNYEGLLIFNANAERLTVPVYMQVAGSSVPVVSIQSINGITQTQANVNCLLTLESGVSVSDYGVCYATTANPTINKSKVSRGGSSSSQNYTCQLTGLSEATEYHVRAYAVSNGTTYYGSDEVFTTEGGNTEDYSSATIESDNRNIEIRLEHCYRNGTRVKVEATILNKGIQPYNSYYIYQNNFGYTLGNITYNSYVEDDVFTTYDNFAVTKTLNNASSNYSITTQLPVGATKKFTIVVDGVPTSATKISIYLASLFNNTTPVEYAFLKFENMPIY